ncbi:MAG TPA: hypothetical protein VM264_01070 [Acidimicrobiales bacterium]|jgi:hypothetical protein|nr:hypothetical protein [Acidimicrobiales bacterium]
MGLGISILWLLGDIVLLFVIVPVVLLLLNRVLRPTMEINNYANDILEHGVGITGALDAVPKLVTTRDLTATAKNSAVRYVTALQRLL